MSNKSIQDLIKSKQKDIQSKKGRARTWKPIAGKNRVRILPSWRGGDDLQFWHDFGTHFVKNSAGNNEAVYICADRTFGSECQICQAIGHGIKSTNDDEIADLLKEANASQRYLMNVLVLSDPDEAKRKEPRIMDVGIGIFESILEIISEYDDITSLDGGVDLVITREGTTWKDTKYTVMPSPKSTKVPSTVMAQVANLDDYVAQENEPDLMKAVSAVGRAAGLLTADDTAASYGGPGIAGSKPHAALPDSDMSSVLTEEEIDEAVIGEIVEEDASIDTVEAAVEEDDIDDDELDQLLAEM